MLFPFPAARLLFPFVAARLLYLLHCYAPAVPPSLLSLLRGLTFTVPAPLLRVVSAVPASPLRVYAVVPPVPYSFVRVYVFLSASALTPPCRVPG